MLLERYEKYPGQMRGLGVLICTTIAWVHCLVDCLLGMGGKNFWVSAGKDWVKSESLLSKDSVKTR